MLSGTGTATLAAMTGLRNAALASEIRAELGRREMSRRELAKLIHKPDTTVARWLRNSTAMDVDEVDAIAWALGLEPLELLTRVYGATDAGPTPAASISSGWRSRRSVLRLIRPSSLNYRVAA